MAKKKTKKTCTVAFTASAHGPSAVLYDKRGRSINVMNFPKGHALTAKEKTRARRRLMAGCAELSRRGKR
jgi:hypothetical protein